MLSHTDLLQVAHISASYPNVAIIQNKMLQVHTASEELFTVINKPAGKSHADLLIWQNEFIAAKLRLLTALTEFHANANLL